MCSRSSQTRMEWALSGNLVPVVCAVTPFAKRGGENGCYSTSGRLSTGRIATTFARATIRPPALRARGAGAKAPGVEATNQQGARLDAPNDPNATPPQERGRPVRIGRRSRARSPATEDDHRRGATFAKPSHHHCGSTPDSIRMRYGRPGLPRPRGQHSARLPSVAWICRKPA
jgi:hypothetical protein